MIEIEPLRKINKQYRELLEKYEDIIEIIEIEDIKRLIGEVRLFRYRQQKCINYFISNIEKMMRLHIWRERLDLILGDCFKFCVKSKN